MDEQAKQRAVGAVVVVGLAVIFVPLILDLGSGKRDLPMEISIPQAPPGEQIVIDVDKGPAKVALETPPIPLVDSPAEQQSAGVTAAAPTLAPVEPDLEDAESVGGGEVPQAPVQAAVSQPPPTVAKKETESPKPSVPPVAAKVAPAPSPPLTGARAWAVQVASFTERKSAQALVARLQKKGYRAFIVTSTVDSRATVRVRIGPDLVRAEADRIRREVERDFKLQAMVVRHQ